MFSKYTGTNMLSNRRELKSLRKTLLRFIWKWRNPWD